MERMTKVIGYIVLVLFTFVGPQGCDHSSPANHSSDGLSLAVAETLHERLNIECGRVGVGALYQGSLACHLLRGIPPQFYPGRWDVLPLEKIFSDDIIAPHLAKQTDVYFSLQATQVPSKNSVVLTINDKKVVISVHGVAKTWCFPRAPQKTVLALLEACSDSSWKKRMEEKGKS